MNNTNLMYHYQPLTHEHRGNSRTIDTLSDCGRAKKERLVT